MHCIDTADCANVVIYAVGRATAEALKGFRVSGTECGNAAALAAYVCDRFEEGVRYIFVCGKTRRPELPEYFRSRSIPLDEVPVYESKAVDSLALPSEIASVSCGVF